MLLSNDVVWCRIEHSRKTWSRRNIVAYVLPAQLQPNAQSAAAAGGQETKPSTPRKPAPVSFTKSFQPRKQADEALRNTVMLVLSRGHDSFASLLLTFMHCQPWNVPLQVGACSVIALQVRNQIRGSLETATKELVEETPAFLVPEASAVAVEVEAALSEAWGASKDCRSNASTPYLAQCLAAILVLLSSSPQRLQPPIRDVFCANVTQVCVLNGPCCIE